LPAAPQKISSAINVALAPEHGQAAVFKTTISAIVKKEVFRCGRRATHSRKNPMSPMRVVINAFFAAAAALGFSIQNPMSK